MASLLFLEAKKVLMILEGMMQVREKLYIGTHKADLSKYSNYIVADYNF